MNILEANSLAIGYNKMIVKDNLSFTIKEGDFILLLGENGSGKSTLIKTIMGFIKPISGLIKYSEQIKKNEIGYMAQRTNEQSNFIASVEEIVISGLLNKRSIKPFYSKDDHKLALYNMKKLGIYDLRKNVFKNLSGGQMQKVLLARALCASSKIIILDEPANFLDNQSRINLYDDIKQLNEEGLTVLMVVHDTKDVIQYANRILYLGDRIIEKTQEEYMVGRI